MIICSHLTSLFLGLYGEHTGSQIWETEGPQEPLQEQTLPKICTRKGSEKQLTVDKEGKTILFEEVTIVRFRILQCMAPHLPTYLVKLAGLS